LLRELRIACAAQVHPLPGGAFWRAGTPECWRVQTAVARWGFQCGQVGAAERFPERRAHACCSVGRARLLLAAPRKHALRLRGIATQSPVCKIIAGEV
jgi:hypothetical protein